MLQFHVTLHARPSEPLEHGFFDRAGQRYTALRVPPALVCVPFAVTFEQAAEALGRLPRMFVEPDGSFVWVSSRQAAAWQVDGVLYDRDQRLLYVDLQGRCPEWEFDQLLAAVGWPATPVMFLLVHEAAFLDEVEFRRASRLRA